MQLSLRKEQFSIAYLRAVAAVAGLSIIETGKVDDDSVDLTLVSSETYVVKRSPRLDVQMKCTSVFPNGGNTIPIQLSRKNYDDMRGEDFSSPRILAVLLVPNMLQHWTEHDDQRALLRHCAYWLSLREYPELPQAQQTKVVHVPRNQQVTPESLLALMQMIGNGGAP